MIMIPITSLLLFAGTCLASAHTVATRHTVTLSSPGCGISHDTGFQNYTGSHQIQSGGHTRYYAINIPSDYNNNLTLPRPVIFDYHGRHSTPYNQYLNSQYYLDPRTEEYLVVYPQGMEEAWQGADYAVPGVNDVQFTDDLLNHIAENYCIDPERVYASGKSNGAGFVDTLACSDVGDRFAAFVMASAALYTDDSLRSCTKKRAIMESHGLLDTTIPYTGGQGKGGDLPDIGTWIGWWATRNCGNDTQPTWTNSENGGYSVEAYSCRGWTDIVKHYKVDKLGHCWPCSTDDNYDALHGTNCNDTVLDYTSAVANHIARWTLSTAPQN